jgi:amino acid transporter
MDVLDKDPFEELKKKSERRNKKLKSAGKIISCLYLALFFGVGIFIAKELWASLEWHRIAGMLIIVLVFSFLSIVVEKKTRGIEKYSTSSKLIRLLITIFMFISIMIFFNLTSST